MTPIQAPFGNLPDGAAASSFTLMNDLGTTVVLTDFGAALVECHVPDSRGRLADVVLGYPDAAGYARNPGHFGATIGRFAGPIAQGRISLDGGDIQLDRNGGNHHIHGGRGGFDRMLWTAEPDETPHGPAVHFYRTSPDGEENYPGNLAVSLTVTLTRDNTLRLQYMAVADRPTLCNLTSHAYFNLRGQAAGPAAMREHIAHFAAEACNVNDADIIATGDALVVRDTPLDFTAPHPIGERLDDPHEQIRLAGGYDHNYLLPPSPAAALQWAATVTDPLSGRRLEMWTTEPGFQFYSGNSIRDGIVGKNGARYTKRAGFCLEAQRAPNWPVKPGVSAALLPVGETYRQITEYRFPLPS